MKHAAEYVPSWIRSAALLARFTAIAGLVTVTVALGIFQKTLTLKWHDGPIVCCVAISPQGTRLVSGNVDDIEDSTVDVWASTTQGATRVTYTRGMVLLTLKVPLRGGSFVSLIRHLRRGVPHHGDRTVKVWDITPRP